MGKIYLSQKPIEMGLHTYTAPNLEVNSVCAEQGFAATGNNENVEIDPQNPWSF